MPINTETLLDSTCPVRAGEELDLEKLGAYLRGRLPGTDTDAPLDLSVEQFPGGHSNLTYLIRVGDRAEEYVLRRPPFGTKVATAHDMGREFRVLDKLAPVFARAPAPVLHCDDSSVLGAPFYLMERVRGVIVRRDSPASMAIDENMARHLCHTLVDTLVELHAVDYRAAGLGDLGKPAGYVARQVTGWHERYEQSQTDAIPAVAELSCWLHDQLADMDDDPDRQTAAATLIHNDFKFDNVVLAADDFTNVVGILDWEMSTVGDPLMDLGTTLCYWVEARDPPMLHEIRFGPTHLPGMLTRRELARRYADKSGRRIDDILFYYAYGLFKTAVVAQQIYYRYKRGHTSDKRFEKMLLGVKVLSQYAVAIIERGHI